MAGLWAPVRNPYNPGMYRALFEGFAAQCVIRIWHGELLPDGEFSAFRSYLDAREASGRRLLGRYAGPDACIDTVSGRCGVRPFFRDAAVERLPACDEE